MTPQTPQPSTGSFPIVHRLQHITGFELMYGIAATELLLSQKNNKKGRTLHPGPKMRLSLNDSKIRT